MHTHTYIYTYIPSTAAEKRARILPEPRAGRQRATTKSDALFPPASAQFRPPSSPMVTLRKTRLPPAYAVSAAPRHPCRRRPRAAPPAFRRRAPPRPAGRWMVGQADSRWTAIVYGGREMTARSPASRLGVPPLPSARRCAGSTVPASYYRVEEVFNLLLKFVGIWFLSESRQLCVIGQGWVCRRNRDDGLA